MNVITKGYKSVLIIIAVFYSIVSLAADNSTNSFNLDVSAISLGTRPKDGRYHIIDYNDPSKYSTKRDTEQYFPEATSYLALELKKLNYTKAKWDEEEWLKDYDQQLRPTIKVGLHYRILLPPLFRHVAIYASQWDNHIPLWEIQVYGGEEGSFRITLPSIIKCISPYFDKNFKGIITCKR